MEKIIQIRKEEIVNTVTHGLGVLLSIAALVLLIVFASIKGNVWHIISFTVFGTALVILYLASTLYHGFTNEKLKALFKKFDHMAIYLLIAGTYTPFCLSVLHGWIGWTLFGVIWGCAIIGIIMKTFYIGDKELFSTLLYIAMGWIAIIAIKPLYDAMSLSSFVFLMLGSIFYTVGTIFFLKDRITYFHGIWHLFVLAGSVFHFFSVVNLLG
jgi:hemolysin III